MLLHKTLLTVASSTQLRAVTGVAETGHHGACAEEASVWVPFGDGGQGRRPHGRAAARDVGDLGARPQIIDKSYRALILGDRVV